MANTKKKTSNSKRTKGARKAAETRKRNEKKKSITYEVQLWLGIAFALFLFLSNFEICGIVGNFLRGIMLGVFGSMGYLFPVIIITISILIRYYLGIEGMKSKIVATIMLFFDCGLLFHLFAYGTVDKPFTYLYTQGSEGAFGGGLIGGLIGNILRSLIGLAGAYIVSVVILIISIVLLTEKSIATFIKNRGKKAIETVKEEKREISEAIKEKNQKIEQDRLKKQEDEIIRRRRIKGIDFDEIELRSDEVPKTKSKDNKQEIHEIKFEGLDDTEYDIPVQDDMTYTYEEKGGHKQVKLNGLDNVNVENAEHATDGEFQPKERIIVSEEAKTAMNRKPYGMGGNDAMAEAEAEAITDVQKRMSNEGKIIAPTKKKLKYRKPGYNLLNDNPGGTKGTTKASLMETANKLKQVLANFGVNVEVSNVSKGPSVTRYELQPELGTKVSRITGLADDIKLNMAAADIRIEAPIPGKAAVGIEIPNEGRDSVYLKELLLSKDLREHKSNLAFPAGKDIAGRVVVADIAKMPHMLIAGTTGSGKSVFTNSILMSILYRTTPEEVRVIVIDPKVVEFQVYNKIPHLLYDVVTDPKKAAGILNWAVAEMTTRYKKFANVGAKDIGSYNTKAESGEIYGEEPLEKMPQILIVIDELADLMMVAAKEVEEAICRLAQLARAAGIHMIIATQRPSVDVITGLIKANIPSRVALTVASGTDSRTIIDMNGAEKLLGNGDMLFYPSGYVKPVRLQGAYVSEKEILDTVNFIRENSGEAEYDDSIDAKLTTDQEAMANGGERDPYFAEAGRLCIEKEKGSTSMIQRQFKVGFNRAARIMEQLYEAGVVGQEEVNKPRKIIMSIDEFEYMLNNSQE